MGAPHQRGATQIIRLADCQLKVTLPKEMRTALKSLAKRRRISMRRLVEGALERELEGEDSGALPDEAAIRDMAILIAVELSLKLQEATIPGAVTLARTLVEEAAKSAIERIEMVETTLRRQS